MPFDTKLSRPTPRSSAARRTPTARAAACVRTALLIVAATRSGAAYGQPALRPTVPPRPAGPTVRAASLRATPHPALNRVVQAAESAGFAGTVVVAAGDSVVYARAAGLADRAAGRAHALDARWRWASVTKQVTAVLVMQQVEAGRLALDQPLADALPAFGGPTARRVTVRQLLQHTSGLPNPETTPAGADGVPAFYRPAAVMRPAVGMSAGTSAGTSVNAAAALGFCAGAGTGEPGARFAYNNCDYLVLGAVLERATGLSYAALVERHLARPLGLTSVRVSAIGTPPDSPVLGYLASGAVEPPFELGSYGAAGALHGTARDLLAFNRALLTGRLLSPASRATLWASEPSLGYAALGAWAFPASLAGCAGPVQVVERRGAIGGVQVRNVLVPERDVSVLVFANSEAIQFGEVWQGRGLTHDLLRAALCE